jgi:hypothetical protein
MSGNKTSDALPTRKRTMSFTSGITLPKRSGNSNDSATNNNKTIVLDNETMDAELTPRSLKQEQQQQSTTTPCSTTTTTSTAAYNYGLTKLNHNCVIIKIDVDGEQNLDTQMYEDRVMISEYIDVASRLVPQKHDTCGIIITTNRQQKFGFTLAEYVIVLQMNRGTVFELHHFATLQHLNPVRCSMRDSIKNFYDEQSDKALLVIVLPSHRNHLVLRDSTLILRNYTTALVTSDDDDMSSKNTYDELSVNRKRQKKNEMNYKKLCDNT